MISAPSKTSDTANVGTIVSEAIRDYHPGTDRQVAARNLLSYGMCGYAVHIGEMSLGFCDHQNVSQNPGQVPRSDVPKLIRTAMKVAQAQGRADYAAKLKPYARRDVACFNPGKFTAVKN
jgi:hypothetical protein